MSKTSAGSLKNSVIPVVIEQLGPQGDGIAHFQGKRVFVPYTCAGDKTRVRITEERKDFLRAALVEVTHGGPERAKPPCRHFGQCGGCSLQHLTAEAYGDFKRGLLVRALRHAGMGELPVAELVTLPHASRRRADFALRHSAQETIFGYYAARSHEVVPIEQCSILAPALQAFLPKLKASLAALPQRRHIHAARVTLADTGLDVTLGLSQPPELAFSQRLNALAAEWGIARLSYETGHGIHPLITLSPVQMRLGEALVDIPAATFLQATAEAQSFITGCILRTLAGKKRVVDLFSGIGTYSFPLAISARVHAVEADAAMTQAVMQAARQLSPGRVSAETRDLFAAPLLPSELDRFDAAVINPPRAGAAAQIAQITRSGLKKIVMVSCDPASFARDAAMLIGAGWQAEPVIPIDQFTWSTHLEMVGIFIRGKG